MKLKKLNLQEITRIYLLLKPAIDGREQEPTFLEEIQKIIELSNPEVLLESIRILYDNKYKVSDPLDFTAKLVDGLRENDFYGFVGFIRGLDGTAKR